MAKMNYHTHEELLDKTFGKEGTQTRDEYEESLKSFLMGDAIKQARLKKNLTQAELGELLGVKRAQISRIENGQNLTFTTIARAFRALGIKTTLNMEGIGKVALW